MPSNQQDPGADRGHGGEARGQGSATPERVGVNTETDLRRALSPVPLSPDLLREIEDACAALMHMEIRINSGIADDADGAGCCTVRSLLRRLAALLGSPHQEKDENDHAR